MQEVMDMPDYKKMYFTLLNAAEDAIRALIQAQEECEEMYLSSEDEDESKN